MRRLTFLSLLLAACLGLATPVVRAAPALAARIAGGRTALDPPQVTWPNGAPRASATWKAAKATKKAAAPRAAPRPRLFMLESLAR